MQLILMKAWGHFQEYGLVDQTASVKNLNTVY